MWLLNYITKNSITPPNAQKGNVTSVNTDAIAVVSSGEHKMLRSCMPYGYFSCTPVGEQAVVLPLDDGEIGIGIVAKSKELEEGEVMLCSKGGASIVLKNDGRVLINGKEF